MTSSLHHTGGSTVYPVNQEEGEENPEVILELQSGHLQGLGYYVFTFTNLVPMVCKYTVCGSKGAVRWLHGLLTLTLVTTLTITPTTLNKAVFVDKDYWYGGTFYGLLILALLMYYFISFGDPGYVPKHAQRSSQASRRRRLSESRSEPLLSCLDDESKPENYSVPLRSCGFCGITQPLRSRHCEDCKRCTAKFDHHCPWLGTCIGEKNHKYFYIFLTVQLTLVQWSTFIAWSGFQMKDSTWNWFMYNWIFLLDIVILVAAAIILSLLIAIHSYLACTNTTTWEYMSRDRITYLRNLEGSLRPFDEGYFCNTINFFFNCEPRRYERIYNTRARDEGWVLM